MGGGGKHSCLRKPSCGDTAGSTFQEHGCSLQILKRLDSHLLMMSGTQALMADTPVQTGSLRKWDMN